MIRPIMMSSSVNFGYKRGINNGVNNAKNNKASEPETETKAGRTLPPKPPVNVDLSSYPSMSEDNRVHASFLLGTLFGAILGGAAIAGYNEAKTDDILNDMMETVNYGVDSVFMKDLTNDNVPDVILHSKDGFKDVYDIKSKKIYIETDDGLVGKI